CLRDAIACRGRVLSLAFPWRLPAQRRRRKETNEMADQSTPTTATPDQRTAAIEMVLRRSGALSDGFVDDFIEHAGDAWVTGNGARMVARAWTDPEFRARMLADGTGAAREMGFEFPEHHRHLVVL